MSKDFNGSLFKILFVDTGDICRSPMAKGYLYKLLTKKSISHISIITCGVMTPTGLHPTPETVQLLDEENIDISRHRSKPLTSKMLEMADLVLGMTPFHVQTAIRKNKVCEAKTHLLKEFVSAQGETTRRRTDEEANKDIQIHDPMGGTIEIYRKAYNEIKEALNALVLMDVITIPPVNVDKPAETRFQSKIINETLEKEKVEAQKIKEEKLNEKKARNNDLFAVLQQPIKSKRSVAIEETQTKTKSSPKKSTTKAAIKDAKNSKKKEAPKLSKTTDNIKSVKKVVEKPLKKKLATTKVVAKIKTVVKPAIKKTAPTKAKTIDKVVKTAKAKVKTSTAINPAPKKSSPKDKKAVAIKQVAKSTSKKTNTKKNK